MYEYLIGLFILFWLGFGFLFRHFTTIYERQMGLTEELLHLVFDMKKERQLPDVGEDE